MGNVRDAGIIDGMSCSGPSVGKDTGVFDRLTDGDGADGELKDIHVDFWGGSSCLGCCLVVLILCCFQIVSRWILKKKSHVVQNLNGKLRSNRACFEFCLVSGTPMADSLFDSLFSIIFLLL